MKNISSFALIGFIALVGAGCQPVTPVATNTPSVDTTVTTPVPATTTVTTPTINATTSTATTKTKAILLPYLTDLISGTKGEYTMGCDRVLFRKMTLSGDEIMRPADTLLKEIFTSGIVYQSDPATGGPTKTAADFGLTYQSTTIKDGLATVSLKGQPQSAGMCDDPRIPGIIEAALCQFPSVSKVRVLVNGVARNFTDQSGLNLPAKDAVCRKEMYKGV